MENETVLRAHGLRTNVGKLIRVDSLDDKPYVVAPVILITEGVHNNVLYSAEELAKHTDAWNGRPLVAPNHPTVNGKPVTANSKRVLEKMKVGMVLNVNWDAGGKKLKGEAWFDKEATQAKCPSILKALEQDDPHLEVSTGLFTDDTFRANSFNGKQYACEAKNHRPDHLAILPGGKGACSWEDGAGLPRINSAMDDDELDENELHVNFDPDQPRDENGRFAEGGGNPLERMANATEAKRVSAANRPDATIREQRRQLFEVYSQDKQLVNVTKPDGTASTMSVRDARRMLFEEKDQDSKSGYSFRPVQITAKQNADQPNDTAEDADEDETCPECGGTLVAGECMECAVVDEAEVTPAKQNAVMHALSRLAERLGFNLNKKMDISLNEKTNRVNKALTERYAPKQASWATGNMPQPCMPGPWVRDLFDDYVIYDFGGKSFKLDYDWADGQPVFDGDAVEVVQNTEWLPKNNSADKWVETEETWDVPGWEAAK